MYIEPGTMLSLSLMFYVCKGLNNIQMVYNGTSCDLNLALWAPHFGLKIFQHTSCALLTGYSQCYMYMGEIFLNFNLHSKLIPYSGVYVIQIKSRPEK